MHTKALSAILPLALVFPVQASQPARHRTGLGDPGGVLENLSLASFPGSGQNSIQALATDPSGNIYVAGTTTSPDLPVKNAMQSQLAVYVTRQGTGDAFVSKLAPDGTPVWTTYLGGSDADTAVALAVDAQGNTYIAGNTTSSDFPSTMPHIGPVGMGSVFVAKFSPDGRLIYSSLIGGESSNTASALAPDTDGNAYVLGQTNSAMFPVTPGVLGTSLQPNSSTAFLAKFSSDGSLVYATYLGESNTNASTIAVTPDAQPIIAGNGAVPGSPPEPNSAPDFVMKLDANASSVLASTYLQGTGIMQPARNALELDAQGDVIVSGEADPFNVPTSSGAYVSPHSPASCRAGVPGLFPGGAIYVTKLAGSDWKPVYTTEFSGSCRMQLAGMALDAEGAPILALRTGAGAPLRQPMLGAPSCTNNAPVIAKLSADGSSLDFATYLDACGLPAIAIAGGGAIYAGVAPRSSKYPAGILRIPIPAPRPVVLDQVANAFSGETTAVARGGLFSLSGPDSPRR